MSITSQVRSLRRSAAVAAVMVSFAGVVALLVSCETTKKALPVATPVAGVHAIHAERLEAAMHELSRFATGQSAIARLYNDAQSGVDLSEVAATAAKIGETADSLPAALEGLQLSDENRRTFEQMAAKMRQETNALIEQAKQNNLAGAQAAIGRLNETCAGCHATFRGPQA